MDQDIAAERDSRLAPGESLIPHSQTMVGLARIVHCDTLNLGRPRIRDYVGAARRVGCLNGKSMAQVKPAPA